MEQILMELRHKYSYLIEDLFNHCSSNDILIHFNDLVDLDAGADFLYVKFFIVNSIVHLANGKCISATINIENLPMFLFLLDQLNLIEKNRILYGEEPKDRKPLLSILPNNIPDGKKIEILFHMDFIIDFKPSSQNDQAVDILISIRNPLNKEHNNSGNKFSSFSWGF